jgi:stage V sporulation protein AC
MNNQEYQELVKVHLPKPKKLENLITTFIFGGLIGLGSELLLELYEYYLKLPRKESGVLVIITLIVISSILTALGIFDVLVTKLKSALIIPITGFAHSMQSAVLDYKKEGLIYGFGSNVFKLAGSVILYGVVSAYVFGLVRFIIFGG